MLVDQHQRYVENMKSDGKCVNEYTRIDQIVATVILVLFFLIGTLSNLSFISIYLHKQRRRCGNVLNVSANGVSIRSTCIRIKNQVSNKAIFTLSISNLLLSSLFIPYTIVFRVWDVDAHWFVLLVLEHFKVFEEKKIELKIVLYIIFLNF